MRGRKIARSFLLYEWQCAVLNAGANRKFYNRGWSTSYVGVSNRNIYLAITGRKFNRLGNNRRLSVANESWQWEHLGNDGIANLFVCLDEHSNELAINLQLVYVLIGISSDTSLSCILQNKPRRVKIVFIVCM